MCGYLVRGRGVHCGKCLWWAVWMVSKGGTMAGGTSDGWIGGIGAVFVLGYNQPLKWCLEVFMWSGLNIIFKTLLSILSHLLKNKKKWKVFQIVNFFKYIIWSTWICLEKIGNLIYYSGSKLKSKMNCIWNESSWQINEIKNISKSPWFYRDTEWQHYCYISFKS